MLVWYIAVSGKNYEEDAEINCTSDYVRIVLYVGGIFDKNVQQLSLIQQLQNYL